MSNTSKILDSFKCKRELKVGNKTYAYFDLKVAAENGLGDISSLPYAMKVLLENLLRHEDGKVVTKEDVLAIKQWLSDKTSQHEISFHPTRVLMQDFTGVPAVVDLAAMRDAMVALKGDAKNINPLSQVDLVIDHSVQVDVFGSDDAFEKNVEREYERNQERYEFLSWGQKAFDNFRVVPPGTGICHQVNLEYLGQTVWTKDIDGEEIAFPDTLVGTDSHTTMINGLAVLGWGVGGIEAEAAMLGQPISMVIPEVIGFKLTGTLPEGATATDLVLTVTSMLRERGVVGKFVEFYGDGLDGMTLADRATLGNMSPEFGSTCAIFPIDGETCNYLKFTGRDEDRVALVEAYAKAQGMWREKGAADPVFTDSLYLDLGDVKPALAGPKRPQDKILLADMAKKFPSILDSMGGRSDERKAAVANANYDLSDGDVVIAAITSCTNTSNPSVMLGAGLVARNARAKGLSVKPWVKTSLAPGSQVVTDYLAAAGLQDDLDALGFNLVGYGCTTCIGNSGPLPDNIAKAIEAEDLMVASVLSGNRNFEGRINPHTKANYLASPPLVVAYALAGSTKIDVANDALGNDKDGNPVYLKDIWPTNDEIKATVAKAVTSTMFKKRYAEVFKGDKHWQAISSKASLTYDWPGTSTYIKNPPFFTGIAKDPSPIQDIVGARALAVLGDSVTTDHISPAGAIKPSSPAGEYLQANDVDVIDFNSYGARRGNFEVMVRGTFANIRLQNEMVPGTTGGFTKLMPDGTDTTIYEAAEAYAKLQTPLIVIAGKEYGTGSSRDWAAKGTRLLGVKAVVAESFERIHRSNLIGMGVLPLQFKDGATRKTLGLDGSETFDLTGIAGKLTNRGEVTLTVHRADGASQTVPLLVRIDTLNELDYYQHDGILTYVLRQLLG